jgi:hypothetical protein
MNIIKGTTPKPLKVVIYGPEGIGKSTFASRFPAPLFIDTEGSTDHMDVARTETPTSLAMLMGLLTELKANNHGFKTLVIDTIDWAERLCIDAVCAKNAKTGIEEFGYGKGYTYVYEAMGRILNLLSDIRDTGMNIVLTAHAAIRKFEQPDEMGAYDRWELKLINAPKCNSCAMVKEWADMVLFASYKTYAVAADKDGKKFKARGGERVMYTTHDPCWDAKNRFGLAPELPFDFGQIAGLFNVPFSPAPVQTPAPAAVPVPAPAPVQTQPAPAAVGRTDPVAVGRTDQTEPFVPDLSDFEEVAPDIPAGIPPALADLMSRNKVSAKEIQFAVANRGYFPENMPMQNYPPDFIQGVLIGAWDQVFEMIKSNRELPFV